MRRSAINDNDYGTLKMRKLESMTANADRRNAGADLAFENTRYGYLIGKERMTFADATSIRFIDEDGDSKSRGLETLPVSGTTPQ